MIFLFRREDDHFSVLVDFQPACMSAMSCAWWILDLKFQRLPNQKGCQSGAGFAFGGKKSKTGQEYIPRKHFRNSAMPPKAKPAALFLFCLDALDFRKA